MHYKSFADYSYGENVLLKKVIKKDAICSIKKQYLRFVQSETSWDSWLESKKIVS